MKLILRPNAKEKCWQLNKANCMLFYRTAGKRHLGFESFGWFVGVWCCNCRDCRPIGEMIMYHEPKQGKKLCAIKSTYVSSHPVLQQKLEPLSSRIPVAVLLMLPIMLVLEAEKESLRSVKMMHVRHVGIVRLVSLRRCGWVFLHVFQNWSGAYLVLLCHGK